MRKILLLFLFLPAIAHALATEIHLPVTAAEGAGITALPDGRPAIRFDPAAPIGSAASWPLSPPLPPGWHTVEIEFGPEQDSRKLIEFQCLDTNRKTQLSVNLYHAPSRTGPGATASFGIYLTQPASTIQWLKCQSRAMASAPLLGITLRPGRPSPEAAFMEAIDVPLISGNASIPPDIGAGHLRALSSSPVSLTWSHADGSSFSTPSSSETSAYLDSPLTSLSITHGSSDRIVLERRFDTPSPILPLGLASPPIPLYQKDRKQYSILITGTGLDPTSVGLADFPQGARMAAIQSWDDGIPQDRRAAELLHRHGWRASFFMNWKSPMIAQAPDLEALGMEVASHSWSHPFYPLQSPGRCRDESILMRLFLESKVNHPVISFAYPFNYGPAFDARGDYVLRAQQEAGYLSARTTLNAPLALDRLTHPLTLSTTSHFLADPGTIEDAWHNASITPRGIFYIWGHTYEMTDESQWASFETLLQKYGRRPSVWYASQGDLMVWKTLRDSTTFTASGDGNRILIQVDAPRLHPWWAARVPLALHLKGHPSHASFQQSSLPIISGEIQFHLPPP